MTTVVNEEGHILRQGNQDRRDVLVNLIRSMKADRMDIEEIAHELRAGGWKKQEVDQAIDQVFEIEASVG
jgi:hypothetical protein